MNNKKTKLDYIIYFRAFAILLIVAGHTIRWGKYQGDIYNWNTYLFAGGTFLFVFIAGFLFQYLSYKFNYLKYLKNKFFNIIMPYFITVFPIGLYFSLFCNDVNNYLYQFDFPTRFINVMLWGRIINEPLWFISMILVFFILSPLIIYIKKNKILFYSLLLTGLGFTILTSRPIIIENITSNINTSILTFNFKHIIYSLHIFLYFLSTYLFGMFCCDATEKNKDFLYENIKNIFWISFICWISFGFITLNVLHLKEAQLAIGKIPLITMILSLFIILENHIKNHKILDKAMNMLADYSFGIFFIHHYFCNLLFFHSPYKMYNGIWHNAIYENTLKAFEHSIGDFFLVLILIILNLVIAKKILLLIGIKNTRMFIGVGDNNQTKNPKVIEN